MVRMFRIADDGPQIRMPEPHIENSVAGDILHCQPIYFFCFGFPVRSGNIHSIRIRYIYLSTVESDFFQQQLIALQIG